MQVDLKKYCSIYVGRDWRRNAKLEVFVGFGYRYDAKPDETVWRHSWSWSSASLPYFLWRGRKIIGYCAFGRCRVWM